MIDKKRKKKLKLGDFEMKKTYAIYMHRGGIFM